MADFIQNLVSLLTGGANQSRGMPMPAQPMPQGRPMVALPQSAPIPTERPASLPGGTFMPGREPTEPMTPVAGPSPEMTNPQNPLMKLLGGGGAGGDFRQMIRAAGAGMANLGNTGGDPFVSFGRGFGGASGYYIAKEQDEIKQAADKRREEIENRALTLREKSLEAELTGGGKEFATRKAAAEQLGLKPDDPAYRAYILTGKMPREDQAPLTAVDKKAILDADELVQANETAVEMLESTIKGEEGKTLNDRAGSGATAGTQAWLARNDPTGFFDDAKGEATTELDNVVIGQALASLKATFGAAPTEGERKILVDLQASIDKTPAERKIVIKRAAALARKRLAFNKQRAAELRGGTFYKPDSAVSTTGGVSEATGSPSADGGLSDPLGIRN